MTTEQAIGTLLAGIAALALCAAVSWWRQRASRRDRQYTGRRPGADEWFV